MTPSGSCGYFLSHRLLLKLTGEYNKYFARIYHQFKIDGKFNLDFFIKFIFVAFHIPITNNIV
jgi:hypothetical protein